MKTIDTGLESPKTMSMSASLAAAEEAIWRGSHPATVEYALCHISGVGDPHEALESLRDEWSELKYENMSDAKIISEAIRRAASERET